MKFSIIIPAYNGEEYIDRCLNSILNQKYDNFEAIVVNDGSIDNTQVIIDKYVKKDKRFISYKKKNGGLSDARNYGLKYTTGDYLLFIDCDDYFEKDFLEVLNNTLINNNYDLVKFMTKLVDDNGQFIRAEIGFNESRVISVEEVFKLEFCEPAWTYCYKKSFWDFNKFKYVKDKIHEDFGLTPQIIMMAKEIYCLNYHGYNYVQRSGSIMSTHSKEKDLKKAYDMLEQYDRLIKINYDSNDNLDIYNSFLANSVISKAKTLKGKDRFNYIKELRSRKVFDLLLENTFLRKMKKVFFKIGYGSWFKW